jgi:hypothetical protein
MYRVPMDTRMASSPSLANAIWPLGRGKAKKLPSTIKYPRPDLYLYVAAPRSLALHAWRGNLDLDGAKLLLLLAACFLPLLTLTLLF